MSNSTFEKKQYHSTIGRREFMKVLGLGAGALGLGGTALGAPFKDLDDMMASPHAERNLPFWVKEVDEPTVEIDWGNMEIFPGMQNTLFNPHAPAWGDPREYLKVMNSSIEMTTKKVRENVPGHSLRDRALGDAQCWGWGGGSRTIHDITPPWTGPDVKKDPNGWEQPTYYYTPEDYGVPKYQGTPEENSRMLRVAGRILGVADMGFLKLDGKIKKLLYGNIRFENVKKGYDPGDGTLVLPDKDLWVICSLIPQSLWMGRYTDRMSWASANTAAYSRANIISNRLGVFLRGLGYEFYGGHTASVGRAVGFGVMSGLAEYGRAGIMVSPQYGMNFRTVLATVTDLPLAVTKPIDAGITQFCKVCKKCGEMCPSGAISMETEPFWGGEASQQAKGIKGWYLESKKCYSYMLGDEPCCSRCQIVCPFTKFNEAALHDLVKMAISETPVLNSVIRKMDDVFGYGKEPDKNDDPWKVDPMDIPLYGLDSSRS